MAALEYFAYLNLASRQQIPKLWLTRNVMLRERKHGAKHTVPWSPQGWPGSLLHPRALMLRCPGMEAHSPGLSSGYRLESTKSYEILEALAREPQGQKDTN